MALGFSFNTIIRRFSIVGLFIAANLFGQLYNPPADYYSSADGLTGDGLRSTLHSIIDNHTNLGYDAMRYAPRVLDVDPNNSGNIILIYSGFSIPGHTFNSQWNREHTWPQSFGADSETMPGADFHHLFPADPGVNSSRSNLIFDWTNPGDYQSVNNAPGSSRDSDSFEPRDADKGRIARAILYMDLRYETSDGFGDFNLAEAPDQFYKRMAKLSVLLQWNRLFPPDDRERRRNHLIYTGFNFASFYFDQGNRNPYIDYPELADAVHTAEDFMTLGTWRIQNFTFDELESEWISGGIEDPDQDMLENLMEFALQTNPREQTVSGLPAVDRGNNGNYFLFSRIKEPDISYLDYLVEYSTDPLDPDSWIQINYSTRDLLAADKGQYENVSLYHSPPAADRDAYYRLTAIRDVPGAPAVASSFDPAIHEVGSLNLFTYTEGAGNGWQFSDWMGMVQPVEAPWYFQADHGWLYSEAMDDGSVWFHDPAMGWFYSRFGLYPFLYSAKLDTWLYFLENTRAPNRSFFNPSSGTTDSESELFDN